MPKNKNEIEIDREDVILLLIEANERLLHKESLDGITRLEKLIYLVVKETSFRGGDDFFNFEPHNFGPFSKDILEAIDFLEGVDLIEVRDRSYTSLYATNNEMILQSEILDYENSDDFETEEEQVKERQFLLTENGRKVANILREYINENRSCDIDDLERVVKRYSGQPLKHLIRYVYKQYPEMTGRSIHPEAERLKAQG